MSNIIEGLKRLYNNIPRQIQIFSVCGIMGLFQGYFMLDNNGMNNVVFYQKIAYFILCCLFSWFIIGYETQFLHEREIPEVSSEAFFITCKRALIFVFLFSIPLFVIQFFPKYNLFAFICEILLAIPFTMIQAGISYNYENKDALKLFTKFDLNDYLLLIFKRLWVIFMAYLIVFTLIFITFFIAGFTIAIIYKGDLSSIGLAISSYQIVIIKLASYISSILLVYFLTTGTLAWDYELVKTYERKI